MNAESIAYEQEPTEPVLVEYDPIYQNGFANLVNSIHEEFGFSYDPTLDKDLEKPEDFYRNIWILINSGLVVGSVALKMNSPEEAELKRMYLAPRMRGKGYGKPLMHTALDEAKQAGFQRIVLDTNRNQQSAVRMYELAGFRLIKEIDDALYYQLNL